MEERTPHHPKGERRNSYWPRLIHERTNNHAWADIKRIIRNLQIIITAVAAILAIGIVLTGCGRGAVPTQPTSTIPGSTNQIRELPTDATGTVSSGPEGQVPQVSMTQEAQGRPGGSIRGRVMSKSDVSTIPHSPLQAFVLIIPFAESDSLLEEVGFPHDDESGFGKLGFTLTERVFERFIVASTTSNQSGDYELQVPVGNYLVCIANLDVSTRSEMLPAHIEGCVEVSIQEGKQLHQDIFLQFGRVTSQ